MRELFREQWWLFFCIGICFICSIFCQLLIAYHIIQIEKESEEPGKAKFLKEWIEEYIREESRISNTSAFIDKKIQQLCIGKWTMIQIKHFSGQALLLMIFLTGLGACKGIIDGKTLGQILPYYIIGILGLYFHFSLTGFINLEEKQKNLHMNMLDFLENKKSYFYAQAFSKEEKDIEEVKNTFGEAEDLELKEIIREILT